MKSSKFTHYYVQSQKDGELPRIVGHSHDSDTGEVYYKFIERSRAVKLMKDEKEAIPTLKYRIIKETTTYEMGEWH